MRMSAPGEQGPSAEARIASNNVEETALTIKEEKGEDETPKAPISNFWVRSSTGYLSCIADS